MKFIKVIKIWSKTDDPLHDIKIRKKLCLSKIYLKRRLPKKIIINNIFRLTNRITISEKLIVSFVQIFIKQYVECRSYNITVILKCMRNILTDISIPILARFIYTIYGLYVLYQKLIRSRWLPLKSLNHCQ